MKRTQSFVVLLALFSFVYGCTSQPSNSSSLASADFGEAHDDIELGVIRGALTLPSDQECSRFVAEDLETEDEVFSIDIEHARIRNHQYSFLYQLPENTYQTRGRLECGDESYYSLPARFVVENEEETEVQYRFFFDVDSDLSQVDLLFCAELLLSQVAPISSACTQEPIHVEYRVDWLREECGNVFLHLQIGNHDDVGPAFAFPDEFAFGVVEAPSEPGEYTLNVSLTSQRGDLIPLAEFIYDVDLCSEDDDSEDDDSEDDDSDDDDSEDDDSEDDDSDDDDSDDSDDTDNADELAHCPVPRSTHLEFSEVVLSTIALDASLSQGVDGNEVEEYYWTVIQRPEGSTSIIHENLHEELEDDPSTPTASFFLDLVGDYILELHVIDQDGNDSSLEQCQGQQVHIHAFTDQEIHIQLTWTTPEDEDEQDERGSDLDLHLLHPSENNWNSETGDCHWRERVGHWGPEGPEGDASLDIDDVDGAGPENINVYRPENTDSYQSDYRVGVYVYNPFIYDLMEARIRVYLNGELEGEYDRDLTRRAQLWEPVGIEWNQGEGRLIAVDRFYEEIDINSHTRTPL